MAPQLGPHELQHIFSFLEARDLLRAAQVNKVWNEVSMTKELWRQLCLRRWASCKAFPVVVGTQTWKKYYFCRSELEFRMESGRPQDFICKAISGHTGMIDQLAYVSPHEYRFDEGARSVVCTVSSDCTVRAWDLQEGSEIWSSAVQPAPLVNVVAYPQLQLVVTVDIQGLIMGWKAKTGSEWAFFSLPASCSSMEACDHPEGPFLLVACDEGTLYTMTVPQLQVVSRVPTFPHSSVSLTCSPDTQWVFVSAQGSDLGPKVFYTQPLLHPSEDRLPVSTTLPIRLSSRACWAPDEAARLMVIHRDDGGVHLVITTFELKATKSRDRLSILAAGQLPPAGHYDSSPHAGPWLPNDPAHLQDPDRVITAALDLSLRVYVWNKKNTSPVLKSCYHLLGGSHRWASGFTHVKSDSRSIAGVEARSTGTSILRSYCFKVKLD
ncbi:F-box and WD-40 domain protein 17 isoform X2 [Mus musculus]|uniref:F-box and WD-40 domain protein 17 isoform X2 n=1 Tax=Mus musculus TaxID=10090 RepID=UPI0003D71A2D|nr:F-box and WD-40 domain protein 17 isoform X2 [Mus musculus]|eukprot:XP_006516891.1 PREDICTED: F-box and WD-40 domain protein 17 isoform X2 [Mus musculus]